MLKKDLRLLIHSKKFLLRFWRLICVCRSKHESQFERVYLQPTVPNLHHPRLREGDRLCFEIGGEVYLGVIQELYQSDTLLHCYLHRPLEAYLCPRELSNAQAQVFCHSSNEGMICPCEKRAYYEKNDLEKPFEKKLKNDAQTTELPQEHVYKEINHDNTDKHSIVLSELISKTLKHLKHRELTCHNISIRLFKCQPKKNDTTGWFYLHLVAFCRLNPDITGQHPSKVNKGLPFNNYQ